MNKTRFIQGSIYDFGIMILNPTIIVSTSYDNGLKTYDSSLPSRAINGPNLVR